MKDRFITLACALAAFLLSIYLLVPAQSSDNQASLPTTEDRGSEGLMGLFRWLEINQLPIYSLREPYTQLIKHQTFAATGNVLIVSMPQQREAQDSEWQALQEWIDRGNTIIVLGAGYFVPDWANQSGCVCDIEQLLSGFGWDIYADENALEQQPVIENKTNSFKQTIDNLKQGLETFLPEDMTLVPKSKHTLLQAVSTVQSKITPSLLDKPWLIDTEKNNLALQLLALPEQPDLTVMWQLEAGSGQILLSLVSGLFSNESLNKADNASFFANIVEQNLGHDGQVIFDDYHFGFSNLYDPELFFSDIRLHKTLGFIGLLWLFYVIGYSNRLAPVREIVEKPSALDFVKAMAGFFSHRLDKKTLAQALTRQLIYDVRHYRHLHDDQAVWQWLEQHPALENVQLELLQKAEYKRQTHLQNLTNTITEIRNRVLL